MSQKARTQCFQGGAWACTFIFCDAFRRNFRSVWVYPHVAGIWRCSFMRRVPVVQSPDHEMYKGFPWFTWLFLPIRFDFTTVPYGDSCQSGLTVHLFPMATSVTSNLIGQNNPITNENALYNLMQRFTTCMIYYYVLGCAFTLTVAKKN